MTTLRRLLVAVIATAALLGAGTTAAQAQSWTHTDPAHDVIRILDNGETRPAPDHRAGDIRRVVARHTSTRVVLRFRTATPMPRERWYFSADIKTRAYSYGVYVSGRGAKTETLDFSKSAPGGDFIRCAGLRLTVDQRTSTTRVVVPRSCLGNPGAVRFTFILATYPGTRTFHDTALSSRTGVLPLSPWIRRG